ncbi:MAG: hypothetical protein PHS41_03035 [Victivallaceae bacterium]|nr:hypothetical protein [Victivallaceae bacterium]
MTESAIAMEKLTRDLDLTKIQSENFARRLEHSLRQSILDDAILAPDRIAENFSAIGYERNLLDDLLAAAAIIRRHPSLHLLAKHLYYRTYLDAQGGDWMPDFDPPERLMGERRGFFALLLALGSVPLVNAAYAKLKIPRAIAQNHHTWIAGTIDLYRTGHNGRYGHNLRQTAWLRLAVDGTLFRLGRLEFHVESKCPAWCPRVYRNRDTNKITVLAGENWQYDCSGHRIANRALPTASGEKHAQDSAILRFDGTAYPGRERIPDSALQEELTAPGKLILSLHIPAVGGPLTEEKILTALASAEQFFPAYLGKRVSLFCCESWILNPAWRRHLPHSNLAQFQRSVFQVEEAASPANRSGLFFLFGRDDGDSLTEYHPTYSLQRAMLEELRQNGSLTSGIMIFPGGMLSSYGGPETL